MKFNINDIVKVRLTEEGLEILKRKSQEVETVLPDFVYVPPEADDEGFVEFQLWDLMQNFGEYMYNGNPKLPIETGIIINSDIE